MKNLAATTAKILHISSKPWHALMNPEPSKRENYTSAFIKELDKWGLWRPCGL